MSRETHGPWLTLADAESPADPRGHLFSGVDTCAAGENVVGVALDYGADYGSGAHAVARVQGPLYPVRASQILSVPPHGGPPVGKVSLYTVGPLPASLAPYPDATHVRVVALVG